MLLCKFYWQKRDHVYNRDSLNLLIQHYMHCKGKGKAVPLQAWSGPEGSRKLR